MKVEILGLGCYKCIKLDQLLREVIKGLDRKDIIITRINDENYIQKYLNLDELPGLVIDGTLVCVRKLPERKTLMRWLQNTKVDSN